MAKNTEKEVMPNDDLAALQAENAALKQEITELKEILAAVEKSETDNKELLEAKGFVICTDSNGVKYKISKTRIIMYQGKEKSAKEIAENPNMVDYFIARGVRGFERIEEGN